MCKGKKKVKRQELVTNSDRALTGRRRLSEVFVFKDTWSADLA